jgi:hypothetical protein
MYNNNTPFFFTNLVYLYHYVIFGLFTGKLIRLWRMCWIRSSIRLVSILACVFDCKWDKLKLGFWFFWWYRGMHLDFCWFGFQKYTRIPSGWFISRITSGSTSFSCLLMICLN